MENGQHAFRLKPPKQLVSQPRTEPITSSAQILFSRKAHRKSRGGCIGCKQRRKKVETLSSNAHSPITNPDSAMKDAQSVRCALQRK